jgi:uncharacterized protein
MATKPLTPFQVLVRDIPVHRRFEVGGPIAADWLAGLPVRDALGAPAGDPEAGGGVAELDFYEEGDNVHATGSFKGFVRVACGRCVDAVKIEIDDKIQVTFMPAGKMPPDEDGAPGDDDGEGAEVGADDLDVFAFDGERVDLEPLLREEIVLAVPYAPLCKEDCKGLCSQCGADLNSGACGCQPPIDPRLAALAKLKGLKLPS